jgi:hypothetical protein
MLRKKLTGCIELAQVAVLASAEHPLAASLITVLLLFRDDYYSKPNEGEH